MIGAHPSVPVLFASAGLGLREWPFVCARRLSALIMAPGLALSQQVVHEMCMREWDSIRDPLSPDGEHPVSRRGKVILAAADSLIRVFDLFLIVDGPHSGGPCDLHECHHSRPAGRAWE